ncbi:MAG: MBOAT family O-acyltransferase [Desulfosoma sp.]|uniref:MBOAT family O-acyltransferase n=2 Tax=Desulfosoma sp. TaxID=2603217 RepID=UPI00404B3680
MVFASPIFLFLFLPLVLAGHFLCNTSLRNAYLLGVSVFFYAWGEPRYVGLMVFSMLLNYGSGLLLQRTETAPFFGLSRKTVLALAVGANLLLLIYYKYAGFLVANLSAGLAALGLPLIPYNPPSLPLGISFFTFQAMSYVIDVYRRHATVQKNPLHCGLYIALFPQLIAGPIVRYAHVASQIVARTVTVPGFSYGVQRFIVGLSKKVLIANPMGAVTDAIFALPVGELTPGAAWLGIACYTLQIYYDFSGYSDMAVGLGSMFGFVFPENFAHPYAARSLRDFWRQWHMTLSSWFRDYLYIPLGGSRQSSFRTAVNLWTVFFLCGLWHGAGWTFIVWGMFHGLCLAWERTRLWRSLVPRLWRPVQHLYTLGIVVMGWVFFRAETVAYALDYLACLFGMGPSSPTGRDALLYCDPKTVWTLVLGSLFAAPVAPFLAQKLTALLGRSPNTLLWIAMHTGRCVVLFFLFLASAAHLAAGTYNPFIYFRF